MNSLIFLSYSFTSDKVLLSYLTNDKVIWTNVTDLLSISLG
jgi:hypothetical protein